MKVLFSEIFANNADGSYTPKGTIRIGDITMKPGIAYTSGVKFSGVDITHYVGKLLEVRQHPDGSVEIIGVY